MPIQAAQYLRMSTEGQQYSIENQESAIAKFATQRGFYIVRTYADSGKSGVVLSTRPGLRELLQDVIGHSTGCHAILVYDVSRWGRFQDSDEAGHYEFICRSNGLPVYYCAEPFENDGSQASALLKTMKRTMAAEFSRQLGIDVFRCKKSIVLQGFRVGGCAPYGMRRLLLSPDGKKRRILQLGMRKAVPSDKVILIPGPSHEVVCVRQIFQMLLQRGMGCSAIARELNRQGKRFRRDRVWTPESVHNVLTNPVYEGTNAWARTTQKLHTGQAKVPQHSWVVKCRAFEAIVPLGTVAKVKLVLEQRLIDTSWSDERILERVQELRKRAGTLSEGLIEKTPGMPSSRTIRAHFGSYQRVFELIGYKLPERYLDASAKAKSTIRLRAELIRRIRERFPSHVTTIRETYGREMLVVDAGTRVSILMCRALGALQPGGHNRWRIIPNHRERDNITLLCLLNETNTAIAGMVIFPKIAVCKTAQRLRDDDGWLATGINVGALDAFYEVVHSLSEHLPS